jgi:dipeptidyl aminopeptidase/acylaminoacyl peptidase
MLKHGCDVIAINYRGSSGYGMRFGELGSDAQRVSDVVAAYNYAVDDLKMSPERVFLYGESYGASLVVTTANRIDPIGGLVLVSWNGSGEMKPASKTRVMVFHGADDPIAPIKNARDSFRRYFAPEASTTPESRMHVLEDEGHHFFRSSSWAVVCTETLKLMQLNDGGYRNSRVDADHIHHPLTKY